jgi:hypothetical protein
MVCGIGRMTRLDHLNVCSNPLITDKIFDYASKLKLEELNVGGTGVSSLAMDRFKDEHPRCKVVWWPQGKKQRLTNEMMEAGGKLLLRGNEHYL